MLIYFEKVDRHLKRKKSGALVFAALSHCYHKHVSASRLWSVILFIADLLQSFNFFIGAFLVEWFVMFFFVTILKSSFFTPLFLLSLTSNCSSHNKYCWFPWAPFYTRCLLKYLQMVANNTVMRFSSQLDFF